MKKCPYCNAVIEENARFCLYCMKELDTKAIINERTAINKKTWFIAVSVVLIFFIGFGIFLKTTSEKDKHITTANKRNLDISTGESIDNTPNQNSSNEIDSSQKSSNSPIEKSTDNKQSDSKSSNSPSTQQGGSSTGSSKIPPTTDSNNVQSPSDEIAPDNNSSNDTQINDDSAHDRISYSYRKAVKGDDLNLSATIADDAIVITHVNNSARDGIYIIPEAIDNKRVISIMGTAFSDKTIAQTVKKIVIPATVKTVWESAFSNCYNLTDIYFCGDSIFADVLAFPTTDKRTGSLTIHSSYSCSDRNIRYYRNSATAYYDATWQQWDKVIDF